MSDFKERLEHSTYAVAAVAAYFIKMGSFEVFVPTDPGAPDECDLMVRRGTEGDWHPIEVKGRSESAETLAAFPTLFVYKRDSWEAKAIKPTLVYVVDNACLNAFMCNVDAHRHEFMVEKVKDNARNHVYEAYTLPTSKWRRIKL